MDKSYTLIFALVGGLVVATSSSILSKNNYSKQTVTIAELKKDLSVQNEDLIYLRTQLKDKKQILSYQGKELIQCRKTEK